MQVYGGLFCVLLDVSLFCPGWREDGRRHHSVSDQTISSQKNRIVGVAAKVEKFLITGRTLREIYSYAAPYGTEPKP